MYNSGFPIPPGFCVTATAFKNFLETTGLSEKISSLLKSVDVDDNDDLQDVAKRIQDMVLSINLPEKLKADILEAYDDMNVSSELFRKLKGTALDIIRAGRDYPYVAVRSSATAEDLPDASFAGQQQTFLNVRGPPRLLESVKGCFASLYTARAIYYREKKGFDHMKVYLSVVVQKQIDSESSGVLFTVNPSTNNKEEIVIEAGWGLGETVVSGSITPDMYVISKSSGKMKEKKINFQEWKLALDDNLRKTVRKDLTPERGKSQKVSDEKILELADLGKKIEEHYGRPQDIEFAIETNKVYIVQSRPITTLKKPESGQALASSPKESVLPSNPISILLLHNDCCPTQQAI